MQERQREPLRYSILDPTGNLTALVESPVPEAEQSALAAALMARHPEVEQLGFLRPAPPGEEVEADLRMAGGEFCGNASMCAAALLLLRRQERGEALPTREQPPARLLLRVSGAQAPVETRLWAAGSDGFLAGVCMPPLLEASEREFSFALLRGELPLLRMEGICHILIRPASPFFRLLAQRREAERAVRDWCAQLAAEGLGLMFLEEESASFRLTPLVYIPGSGTLFWENSCASGSAAVGAYLAAEAGGALRLELRQPGGSLRVESAPGGETWLCGRVRLLESK